MNAVSLEMGKIPETERILSGNGKKVKYFKSAEDLFGEKLYSYAIQNMEKPEEFVTITEQNGLKSVEKSTKDLYVALHKFTNKMFDLDFTISMIDNTGKKGWPYHELKLSGKWMEDGSIKLGNSYENLTATIQKLMKEYNTMPNVMRRYVDGIIKGMCKGK